MYAEIWAGTRAVLFDLDGVLTPTDRIHEAAWEQTLRPYLDDHGLSPYTDQDYDRYVNGRPRLDGIRAVLEARGVHPDDTTVTRLGDEKNATFLHILATEGSDTYPDAMDLLAFVRGRGLKTAVVSSSANATAVLEAAGIVDQFDLVVSGVTAREERLAGKPAPDPYAYAARHLGVEPAQTAVIEDAAAGVTSGDVAGAVVVGINRGAGRDALTAAGADIVVDDLRDLIAESVDAR
jgi:beta-phosphoglucomutase family hydrolase